MKTVSVPWGMWYDNTKFDLTFPDSWDVTVSHMVGGPDIGEAGIRKALAEPIGAPPLREVARGRRDAAILIDDLTRPTPSYRFLPYILEELAAGGLGDDKVRIVCAVAAHRPMTRADFVKKIGEDLLERVEVINHNAYDNLEYYGNSSQGIPIWVNREFARSDLKIAAGMITPRGSFFGGGAKLLLPGACGRETIYLNHSYCPSDGFREHIEEVARIVGLQYIVNPLLNPEGQIMAMVAGETSKAYWHGVEIGRRLYRSVVPSGMDAIITNAWPKDTEGTQAGMGRVPLYSVPRETLQGVRTTVLTACCPEGLGFHSVMMPGTTFRLRGTRSGTGGSEGREAKVQQIVFSPNLTRYEAKALFGEEAVLCKTWDETRALLEQTHGAKTKVAVFPTGAIQYGVTEA
jgi:nickel-dependent lactate racemase